MSAEAPETLSDLIVRPARTNRRAYDRARWKVKRFVDEYVLSGNAAQAARAIGFKGKRPNDFGYKLLRLPHVKEMVRERQAEAIAHFSGLHVRLIHELTAIATFRHRMIRRPDGGLLPVAEWPDHVDAAIGHIEMEEEFTGAGDARIHVGTTTKYKPWPKIEANKLLLQYLELLKDKHEHTGPKGGPIPLNHSGSVDLNDPAAALAAYEEMASGK